MRPRPRQADPPSTVDSPLPGPLTADVVLVGVVHLLHPPVAEGQLPHPVHATMHAGAQAQVGSRGRTVEAIGGEVVGAGETEEGEETGLLVGRWELLTRRPVGGLMFDYVPERVRML